MSTPNTTKPNAKHTDDRFDQVARFLAMGSSRRQVLKGFAAGLSATLISTFGLGRGPSRSELGTAHAAGDETIFLPLLSKEICSVATSCDETVFCSEDETCRCILSAEGELRCGTVPNCEVARCTTSADCAHLGEGYFCDTPFTGCCADNEQQRCISPCDLPRTSGTWTGTITYEAESIGVQFVLVYAHEQREISGRMLLQDPVTLKYLETGAISGSRSGTSGFWTTEGGSEVDGEFGEGGFTGSFTFGDYNNESGIAAAISLTRTGN